MLLRADLSLLRVCVSGSNDDDARRSGLVKAKVFKKVFRL